MSAAEIIEQIKTLPPAEQKAVVAFARSLPDAAETGAQSTLRYADPERAKAIGAQVFAENEWVFRKLAE